MQFGPQVMSAATAGLTPLQLRTWRREAQSKVRVALTSFKDAISKFDQQSSAGQRCLTQLTNAILNELLIGTRPMGVLKDVKGLQEAARRKLGEQQRGHMEEMQACVEAMTCLRDQMQWAYASVSDHRTQLEGRDMSQCLVFHTITLDKLAQLLQCLVEMYEEEVKLKQSVCSAMEDWVHRTKKATTWNLPHSEVEQQLTVFITTWMVRPYIDEDRVRQILKVMTDDMSGF